MAELICIVCPRGCHLKVEKGQVTGNFCKRGITYGLQEAVNPQRMLTTTVTLKHGKIARLPVATSQAIPKHLLFDCLKEIKKISLVAPVLLGTVIIKNILGTKADIIATRTIEREENI